MPIADHHQLTLILDVLGTPTMEDYYGIKSRRAREYIRSLPFKKKIPWKAMFPKTSDLALDLLERLLAFNPVKRITVEEALKHPYLEPRTQFPRSSSTLIRTRTTSPRNS